MSDLDFNTILLYTTDNKNFKTKNDALYNFTLKIDRITEDYVIFNYSDLHEDLKNNCLKYFISRTNEWVDHPPDRKRYKIIGRGAFGNGYFIEIDYHSIHIGRINEPYYITLIFENSDNSDEIVAS